MNQANFRFFSVLNDLLPPGLKGILFPYQFRDHQSVKHLVEALGIPHTEVHQVLANGRPVELNYIVRDGDQIEVYPVTPEENFSGSNPSRSDGQPRFILDNHLGKLAVYLRMLGFDSLYRNDYQDVELAQTAAEEGRTLLTRDRRLLMRKLVTHGYCVRTPIPEKQIEEVLRRFDLFDQVQPFRRCIRCNGLLQSISKEEILERLLPLTRRYFDEFSICPECGQIYWKGSHHQRMAKFIQQLVE